MDCVCDAGIPQLHQKRACRDALAKVRHISLLSRKGTSGKNHIDLSVVPVTEQVFKSLYQDPKALNRLHTVYDIKDTGYDNRDFRTKEYNDGTSERLGGGGLDLQFVTKKSNLNFIAGTLELDCVNPDVFLHLGGNKIVGYADPNTVATDKKLYPIPVDRIEITKWNPTNTDDDTAHVEVTIHFDEEMKLSNWIVVDADEHEWDEAENYEPQSGIAIANSGTDSTNVVIDMMYASNGIMGNSVPAIGFTDSDFTATINGTSDVILTAVESPAGVYTFGLTTSLQQGDVVEIIPAVDGYIFPTVTQTIP